MKIIVKLFILTALLSVSACGHEDLQSPCVGAEGSPCERHKPANQA